MKDFLRNVLVPNFKSTSRWVFAPFPWWFRWIWIRANLRELWHYPCYHLALILSGLFVTDRTEYLYFPHYKGRRMGLRGANPIRYWVYRILRCYPS